MTDYTDDIDREESRRENTWLRKQSARALNGYFDDPQNERPDCDEDEPGQYVQITQN